MMKIDGKQIALELIKELQIRADKLKENGITPHLYIITFGNDPQTESYLKQKLLRADQIGAKITIKRYEETVNPKEIFDLIHSLNHDVNTHGIIVQRPMPSSLNEEEISSAVTVLKDVDGFNPDSNFEVPVALAVFEILKRTGSVDLENKNIILAGKGITAGKPIYELFSKRGLKTNLIDSKTKNEDVILKEADIIVSSVGKKIINANNVKKGVILIGVGMHTEGGKLKGDYDEVEIEHIASFYTPTPGGVGPVNVTMLMKNLVEAAERQLL